MMKATAVVLAAGRGSRMKSDTKKQFMTVNGAPIIAYSLKAFEKSRVDEIVLVTGSEDIDLCQKIAQKYDISKCYCVVAGGETRAESVLNGIKAASADHVLIHDGARPLVSQRVISDTLEALERFEAVVPVIPVKDTIRQLGEDGNLCDALDRTSLFGMQTPQAFRKDIILKAYRKILDKGSVDFSEYTDDVMIVEKALGIHAHPVQGEEMNKKITTPEDLVWLESQLF